MHAALAVEHHQRRLGEHGHAQRHERGEGDHDPQQDALDRHIGHHGHDLIVAGLGGGLLQLLHLLQHLAGGGQALGADQGQQQGAQRDHRDQLDGQRHQQVGDATIADRLQQVGGHGAIAAVDLAHRPQHPAEDQRPDRQRQQLHQHAEPAGQHLRQHQDQRADQHADHAKHRQLHGGSAIHGKRVQQPLGARRGGQLANLAHTIPEQGKGPVGPESFGLSLFSVRGT
ncbi:hypothetical protein D3C71_1537310 [compost metagenome]